MNYAVRVFGGSPDTDFHLSFQLHVAAVSQSPLKPLEADYLIIKNGWRNTSNKHVLLCSIVVIKLSSKYLENPPLARREH